MSGTVIDKKQKKKNWILLQNNFPIWIKKPSLFNRDGFFYEYDKADTHSGIANSRTPHHKAPVQDLSSPSHKINSSENDPKRISIELDDSEQNGGNRDFILRYQLAGKQINSGLLLYEGEKENFFMTMMQAPKRVESEAIPPREYIFVVDVSGSMRGHPIEVSKKLMRNLLVNLKPQDQFNVLVFAGTSGWLSDASLSVNEDNLQRAFTYIDSHRGGGSTQIIRALKKAMSFPRRFDNLSRSVVIITDGYVNVETETFDLIRDNLDACNVFSFGIGSSVNRFIIEGMARTGQGEPLIITDKNEAGSKAEKFRKYISTPVLSQIHTMFEGFEAYDIYPKTSPDLFADRPIVVYGKWRGKARGKITLSGNTNNEEYVNTINVSSAASSTKNKSLKYIWARNAIKEKGDYYQLSSNDELRKEITNLGLKYNLLTKFTSFLAIDKAEKVNKNKDLASVTQPNPMPQNVSNYAVGADLSIDLPMLTVTTVSHTSKLLAEVKVNTKPINEEILSQRKSVTFILGKDEIGAGQYFKNANDYFRNSEVDQTDIVIDSIQTIVGMMNYLSSNAPLNKEPWGKINVVVHGNEWSGISASIQEGGKRTTIHRLLAGIENQEIVPLKNSQLDGYSLVQIYACGLAANEPFLNAFALAMGGKNDPPHVRSSNYFVSFNAPGSGAMSKEYAQAFYAFYKTGYHPGDIKLARQFASRYKNEKINWRSVMQRTMPRWDGDTYLQSFDVPVVYTAFFDKPGDRPDISTSAQQLDWVKNSQSIQDQLKNIDIDPSNFTWTVNKVKIQEDGKTRYAIKAIGLCRVACVLKHISK